MARLRFVCSPACLGSLLPICFCPCRGACHGTGYCTCDPAEAPATAYEGMKEPKPAAIEAAKAATAAPWQAPACDSFDDTAGGDDLEARVCVDLDAGHGVTILGGNRGKGS